MLNELVESLCEQIFLKRYISTTTSRLHHVFDLHCILASFVQSLDLTSSPTSYFMECLPNFKECLPFSRSIIMTIGWPWKKFLTSEGEDQFSECLWLTQSSRNFWDDGNIP